MRSALRALLAQVNLCTKIDQVAVARERGEIQVVVGAVFAVFGLIVWIGSEEVFEQEDLSFRTRLLIRVFGRRGMRYIGRGMGALLMVSGLLNIVRAVIA